MIQQRALRVENGEKVDGFQFEQEQLQEEVDRQGTELKKCQDKIEMMSNILIKSEQEREALKQ